MKALSFLNSVRLLAVAGVLALLTCTGCLPNVAWMPDSSGFVHCGQGGQVLHYDLATQKHRVVVQNTGASTIWPALSPDGKRVAVARYLVNKDYSDTLEVIIYDMQGKEIQHSTVFDFTPSNESRPNANGKVTETYLVWSPKTEHIIIMAGQHTGLYDVRNDGLMIFDHAWPLVVENTPVRPEGDGFLISRGTNEEEVKFAFVTWEGREYSFATKPLPVTGENDWPRFPFLYHSRWEGNTAFLKNQANGLRLDTRQNKGSVLTDLPPDQVGGHLHQQVFFSNRAELRVVRDPNASEKSLRVEYLEKPDAKPRVLVDRGEICLVYPSPNKQYVALRCAADKKGNLILVVNEKGEFVAEVPVN